MSALTEVLNRLQQLEQVARQNPELLQEMEQQYESLVPILGQSIDFLSARNKFRVRNAAAMRLRRPRVLYGSRQKVLNFHSWPLLQVADVIFVTLAQQQAPEDDLIRLDPFDQGMSDVLAALPDSFVPDLYFDYQTCALDRFLRGLEAAPFPTVAGLCHHHRALKCDAIARQFDYVLPLSKVYCEILALTVDPAKIVEIPFGMSWGSFHHVVAAEPDRERKIDVLLTLNPEDGVTYGPYRGMLKNLFDAAKDRWGDRYRFEHITGVDRPSYLENLASARIVLNAVGIHGPYNYRSCEAINAGALLMQYEPQFVTGPQGMQDYLRPDEEYIGFDEHNFEAQLDGLLEHPKRCREIAARGQSRLVGEYGYPQLYERLIATVTRRQDWRARRGTAQVGALARLQAYLQTPGTTQFLALADLPEACAASGTAPAAFLIPLYRSIANLAGPQILENMIGFETALTAPQARALAFYDAALAALPEPAVVDRFNHLVLCAGEGRIDPLACRRLAAELEDEPALCHNAIARIVTPDVPSVSATKADYATVAIRNIGFLLARSEAARQAAARDFMRFWLIWLAAGSAETSHEAQAILDRYPLTEPTFAAT